MLQLKDTNRYLIFVFIFGQSTDEYFALLEDTMSNVQSNDSAYQNSPYGFDSAWAIAMALHQANQELQMQSKFYISYKTKTSIIGSERGMGGGVSAVGWIWGFGGIGGAGEVEVILLF